MQFRLGSIPVRIHGSFLLIALLFAAGDLGRPEVALASVVVIFLSILVHELGHALVGRAFGLAPRIDLHGMGGTTSWLVPDGDDAPRRAALGTWRKVAISLAGPFAGFALGALAFLAYSLPGEGKTLSPLATALVVFLFRVNTVWGVFNLLPMLPLDGGNVLSAVLTGWFGERGARAARYISIPVAIACGVLGWIALQSTWLAFLSALFVYSNVQALRSARAAEVNAPLVDAIHAAYAALDREDWAEAARLARRIVEGRGGASDLRATGVRILAYASLVQEDWGTVLTLVASHGRELGPEELARCLHAAERLGRAEEAALIQAAIDSLSGVGDDFRA